MNKLLYEDLSYKIIGAARKVYKVVLVIMLRRVF